MEGTSSGRNDESLPLILLESRAQSGGCAPPVKNVLLLSLGFLAIFTAFNTTQSLETSLDSTLGFWSLALLYSVFTVSLFFSPYITRRLGRRTSLIIGALLYVQHVLCMAFPYAYLLLPSGAVLGFGSALIWTSQGACMAENAIPGREGLHASLFWSIFQGNFIPGNLLIALAFGSSVSSHPVREVLFTILACCGALSVLFFAFLRAGPIPPDPLPPLAAYLKGQAASYAHPVLLLLAPMAVFSGASQAFYFGVIPPKTGSLLGYIMVTFGVADFGGSLFSGRLSDTIGRAPVVVFLWLVLLAGQLLCLLHAHFPTWAFFFFVGLLGFGDGCVNTQTYSLLSCEFPTRGAETFAWYQSLRAAASGAMYFIGPYISFTFACIAMMSLVTVSVLAFLCLECALLPARRARSSQGFDLLPE